MSSRGGIIVALEPEAEQTSLGPRTLAAAIYLRLRADILAGKCPPAERLPIGPLARRFNVSFASVREALSRLVADGLVVAEDQRGFRVSPLSLADLMDVTHTRIELECVALRRSIEWGDAAWRTDLERAWRNLQAVPHTSLDDRLHHSEAWSLMHGRFHAALASACGLDWLLRFRSTLYEQSERYRRLGLVVASAPRDVAGEHGRIFQATMDRDVVTATAELTRHFERTAEIVKQAYMQDDP